MGTKSFDNYADLITFSRASGGTALRKISYGPELVTNGTFDTDTNWSKTSTVTISGGVANIVSDGSYQYLLQPSLLEVGKVYEVRYEITSSVSGSLKATTSFNISGGIESTVGSHSFVGTAKITSFYIERNSACDISIDNISVKEVLFDQPDGTLTLFNHPDNTPRIEYDADGNRLGLLIEEQRTNLVTYSEQMTGPLWGTATANTTVTDDAVVSPSGDVDASTVIETTATGPHRQYNATPYGGLNGIEATYSVFVKPIGDTRHIYFLAQAGADAIYAHFNMTTKTVHEQSSNGAGVLSGARIEEAPNGYYRLILTGTIASSVIYNQVYFEDSLRTGFFPQSYAGDGQSGFAIYGWQLEAGAFPTSYIPTSGSTATRAADVASIPVSDFGYNQSEGTVVVEVNALGIKVNTTQGICGLYNDNGNRHYMYFYNALVGGVTLDNSASQANISGKTDYAPDAFVKSSYAYKINDFASIVDGGAAATDTSGSLASGINSLLIGRSDTTSTTSFVNGHIKSIKYYPRRLTNDQLQELTQ